MKTVYLIKYEFFGNSPSDLVEKEFEAPIELDEMKALQRARSAAILFRSKELSESWSMEFVSMTIKE
jgi:hypothetical protein